MLDSIGAVVVSRNDNYGGDLAKKFTVGLNSLIDNLDEVYYVDWNSPDDISLFDVVEQDIHKTGKLHVITITQNLAKDLTNHNPDVQACVEVMARNIGIRRLKTDWIISTNSDIMVESRENIKQGLIDKDTFHCIARTEVQFNTSPPYYLGEGFQHATGSPLGERDRWSLITCPGDFQLAHKNLWYGIKGYDENLVYRGYSDSNVQRKADYFGYKLALVRSIKAYHFAHYPNHGASGGHFGGFNDPEGALFNYQGTTNPDTWGFSNYIFSEEIV
jgi:hypothetical protein